MDFKKISAFCLASCAVVANELVARQPNIVIIKTDQQRTDTIRAWGNKHMITPNMDKLAKEGISFTNNYSCAATCTASRAAFYTGLMPNNTGVYHFDPWTHIRTWLHDLKDNGYYIAGMGKVHHAPDHRTMGAYDERIIAENAPSWEYWDDYSNFLKFNKQENPFKLLTQKGDWDTKMASDVFPLEEKYHSDHFIGESAVTWLENYDYKKPFFLHVGFVGPHDPFDPPARVLEKYDDVEIPKPIYAENELDNKPPQYKRFISRKAGRVDYTKGPTFGAQHISYVGRPEEDVMRWRKHYYAKVTFVDEQVGKIMDTLEKKGLLDNTIVIFTSDHGENLGDHQLVYKWLLTEEVTNVPMIIRLPKAMNGGRVDSDLFTQIDIGPTVLDFAKVPAPVYLDGKSNLKRLTENDRSCVPEQVYCMDNYQTMVRTKDWRMIHFAGEPYGEFYDVKNDPHNQNNLWDNPKYQDEIKKVKTKFFEWFVLSTYLGSVERCDRTEKEMRKHPKYFPNDPYFIQGWNLK